jgi:hypothetical protein
MLIVMRSIVMLCVIIQSVSMMDVIKLNDLMVSVVAPSSKQ